MLAIKAFAAAIIFFTTLYTILILGPVVEASTWPVISKLELTAIEADEEGNVIVRARFNKYRQCEYVGLSWQRRLASGETESMAYKLRLDPNDTGSPNRPLGVQRAGPWLIYNVTPQEVVNSTFAEVTHRCHVLWNTTTRWYP